MCGMCGFSWKLGCCTSGGESTRTHHRVIGVANRLKFGFVFVNAWQNVLAGHCLQQATLLCMECLSVPMTVQCYWTSIALNCDWCLEGINDGCGMVRTFLTKTVLRIFLKTWAVLEVKALEHHGVVRAGKKSGLVSVNAWQNMLGITCNTRSSAVDEVFWCANHSSMPQLSKGGCWQTVIFINSICLKTTVQSQVSKIPNTCWTIDCESSDKAQCNWWHKTSIEECWPSKWW